MGSPGRDAADRRARHDPLGDRRVRGCRIGVARDPDAGRDQRRGAEVLFLVAVREKAAMLHRMLDGPRLSDLLPAQAVAPRDGRLTWLVDATAVVHVAMAAGTR